jgi:hypothetical protein
LIGRVAALLLSRAVETLRLTIVDLQWGATAAAAAVLGLVVWRARRRRWRGPRTGWLTDAMVEEIIARGRIDDGRAPGGPLDLEAIRRAEDRFWSEEGDTPDGREW